MEHKNTFTLWLKIADRLNNVVNLIQHKLVSEARGKTYEAFSFKSENGEDSLVKKEWNVAREKTQELIVLKSKLLKTIALIKASLAEENAKLGVNIILSEQNTISKQISLDESLLIAYKSGRAKSFNDAVKFVADKEDKLEKAKVIDNISVSVSVFDDTFINELEEGIERNRLQIAKLSDRLSDLNATKLSLVIDGSLNKYF